MLRFTLLLLACFFMQGAALAQLNGAYGYQVPGVGNTKIIFKTGKQFEYIINDKSGKGSYKKRGKKYLLNFKDYDTNPLARSFFELVKENESKEDSIKLKIRVFDNVQFDALVGSVVLVKNTQSDSILFDCTIGFDGMCTIKIPKKLNEISLNVSYSSSTEWNETFNVTQDMTINVYLSCIIFNQVIDGCLSYAETDKLNLKIRQKNKNGIWICYPQARSKYIKFTKTD